MTAQSEKTEQMRLDSCVWAPSKRDKVHETPRQNASETRKNGDFLANTIARVEIIRENSQGHHNMSLLGKYPFYFVSAGMPVLLDALPDQSDDPRKR